MATPPISSGELLAAVEALEAHGTQTAAAEALGLSRGGLQGRLKAAKRAGISTGQANPDDALRAQVKSLEAEVRSLKAESLTSAYVRKHILGLANETPAPPGWLVNPKRAGRGKSVGVPTLFASDWHWGEVVNPTEIGGVNEFNLTIARARFRTMIETAVYLLTQELPLISYPGIVFALGGDMVTGDIHEELSVTNEAPIMPTIIDVYGVLIWAIETLADVFGHVFVPCVAGNHGRNTRKPRAKQRAFTNFDWLIYQLLEKHFAGDKRVTFLIPDGPDARWKVYGTRYLMTHGDQFRGGDGIIGSLGPIARGDYKKRSRNAQIDQDYDTMLLGHFHQLIQMRRFIVNGSGKGYDEYAAQSNFPFEPPAQALWITHPEFGITFQAPIFVERPKKQETSAWVSIYGPQAA